MNAMSGISMGNFHAFAQKFDFSPYKTMCDVGGATAQLSIVVARHQEHLTLTSFDLPPVEPIAKRSIAAAGLEDRISTAAGDSFEDPLPKADVITMGMILHDWKPRPQEGAHQGRLRSAPPWVALSSRSRASSMMIAG